MCAAYGCILPPSSCFCTMPCGFGIFVNGREVALLHRAFLFVPMPLAVFPVLYYLCAAVWLRNNPATVIMAIFGAAHLTVSLQSFR